MLYGILKANKTGHSSDMYEYLASQRLNTDMNIKERERTGAFPMIFYANGTDLLDWSIRGAAGGVGRIGKNYLKQTEITLPSGAYGKRVYTTTSWSSARTGTLNSGNATTIGFNLHKADNSNITPANVGRMYIVEGNADPETEGVELEVFQGGISPKGDYQRDYYLMRFGDDGYGNTQELKPNGNAAYIPIRCGTALFELKPDTNYKYARIGGDEDVEIQYTTGRGTRTISVEFLGTGGIPAIPNGGATTVDEAQWCKMKTSQRYFDDFNIFTPIDNRAECYDNCTAFAELKAGHYKVIAEAIIKDSKGIGTMIYGDDAAYFMLIDDNNNKVLQRTAIFQSESLWHHEEYDFTLAEDTKVGLFCKAYYDAANYSVIAYNFIRFMIVDYAETAVPFDVTSSYGQLTGVSCWEPYHVTLPLTLQHGELSTDVEIDLGTSFLGENDSVSFSVQQPSIPTYSGKNIIRAATETQPSQLYIKYKGTSQ